LFSLAVTQVLRDHPVTVSGGLTSTIGELWDRVLASVPAKNSEHARGQAIQLCVEFNSAFEDVVSGLVPQINGLLTALGWHDVELKGFRRPGVTYLHHRFAKNRLFAGQELVPNVTFRGHPLPKPQLFLNEARLSALGLSIYLAGRLACTPTANTNALKLLVLDDVLIGLDHSIRLPVLDVLQTKFADWQIVLLTHDRNWFDLARSHLPETGWRCVEIFEGDGAATAPIPIVRATQNRPARALLEKAKELVETPYIEAAANYARQAFELGVRAACEVKGIAMPFRVYPKTDKPPLQAQDFLDKLKQWPGSNAVPKADWDAALNRLETLKNVVMNPYSHPSAPNIPKQEVEQAIDAVDKFPELVRKN
jgi:hypothetical protein